VLGSNQRPWDHRPKSGAGPELPAWTAVIGGFTAVKAFGLGVLLIAMCPRNRVGLVCDERADMRRDVVKGWLLVHSGAVMTVWLVVLGVDLASKGLPPLWS